MNTGNLVQQKIKHSILNQFKSNNSGAGHALNKTWLTQTLVPQLSSEEK